MAKEDNLKSWVKGQSGNPKGRAKSIINRLEDLVGYEFGVTLSKEDRYRLLQWMLDRPREEIQMIANDPSTPAFLVNIAAAVSKDIKEGRIVTMDSLMDRCFGRSDQKVIVEKEEDPLDKYSADELEAMLNGLRSGIREKTDAGEKPKEPA